MDLFWLFFAILISFAALLLAWFAISSCLGDEIRSHFAGRDLRTYPPTFGQQYARMMGNGSQAGWEQIEMQDMLDKNDDHER